VIREIVIRIKSNLGLKIALSSGLTISFCVIYLLLQRHPFFTVTEMKITWIDRNIPFVPGYVYLYESLWLLIPVAPWLMKSKDDLVRYCKSLVLISLAGFCIFFFYPTSSPRPKDLHDINVVYGALIRVENELNAFPSLHVALAFLSGASCHDIFCAGKWPKWLRCIVWVWVMGVVASTLLTKQHVFIDAVAGGMLGFGGYTIICRRKVISI
jgi:membrane-associated phospholipid phosphatase